MNWNNFYFNAGAGKSTLLNLLVGRETKGIDMKSGTIKINGEKASKFLRRKIGYVLQEDIFFFKSYSATVFRSKFFAIIYLNFNTQI